MDKPLARASERDRLDGRELFADDLTVLMQGDALRVLEGLPSASIDLVLADPPYSSGGAFRGDRAQSTATKYVSSDSSRRAIEDFTGDVRDQRSYLAWSTLWLSEAYRTLQSGRACVVFTDWRQLPTTTDAIQAGGFIWRGICVWDKVGGRPAPGIANGATEYAVWGTKGPINLGHEVYLPGILRASIPHDDRDLHQTPKPLELLTKLATLAPPGGIVLDPFTGSGSAVIAARRAGRRSIGVELSHAHAGTATQRIIDETSQLNLLERAA
jgi:site-specific DNA-methyltransferase (adenine-specific)